MSTPVEYSDCCCFFVLNGSFLAVPKLLLIFAANHCLSTNVCIYGIYVRDTVYSLIIVKYVGVSKNRGKTPQIIPFVHRVFHYKPPSILGGKIPLFLVQHPMVCMLLHALHKDLYSICIHKEGSRLDMAPLLTERLLPVPRRKGVFGQRRRRKRSNTGQL